MRQRGRQSAASVVSPPTQNLWSADAPDYLNEDQRKVWNDTVSRLGHGWFPAEVLPLLSAYCCAVVMTRTLQQQLDNPNLSPSHHSQVSSQWQRSTALMLQLATKLRITTQSVRAVPSHKPKTNAKPWQTADSERD
jgi:hypothetical protein